MGYANVQDYLDRMGEKETLELTDRDYQGQINEVVLQTALDDASSQIDGYLVGRYTLPLGNVPRNLTRLCCDLARYRLCSKGDTTISEEVIERYKLSLKELEALASGKMALVLEEADDPATSTSDTVLFSNPKNRVFGRDNQN